MHNQIQKSRNAHRFALTEWHTNDWINQVYISVAPLTFLCIAIGAVSLSPLFDAFQRLGGIV